MPRKSSRSAPKAEETSPVTRTGLRSRSRGGAAVSMTAMDPPPSPSSKTSSPAPRRQAPSQSPSPKPRGRSRSAARTAEPAAQEATSSSKQPAKGKSPKKASTPPVARGRRGRPAATTAEPKQQTEETEEKGKEEKPTTSRGRSSSRKQTGAKSKKEEDTTEEEKAAAQAPVRVRRRSQVSKSEEPIVVLEKTPMEGKLSARRSVQPETTESPQEEKKDPPSRRRGAIKSPEPKPSPSPRRRGRGKVEEPTDETKSKPQATEVGKTPPRRTSRGKVQKATTSKQAAQTEEGTDEVDEVTKEKEELSETPEPEKMETSEQHVPELKAVPSDTTDMATGEPSPTRKRKRETEEEEVGSPPKKRKPSGKDEELGGPLGGGEAMETEQGSKPVVDSSSSVEKAEAPSDSGETVKEAEAVTAPEEPPAVDRVQTKTDTTETPTSSHEVISAFPGEGEQLTPEAEPAEVESLPTPAEEEVNQEASTSGPEPDQSDESTPTAPAPMPDTREAEHTNEEEQAPISKSVAAPEPVQSSQEVSRAPAQPAVHSQEPDQSSSTKPVTEPMETDLSSSNAEASTLSPVKSKQVPEVVEPEIVPTKAQMLEDASAAPSSSSPRRARDSESQGSEAVPVKSTDREAMEVDESTAPVSSTIDADSGANTISGQRDDTSDYVVVNMEDVPAKDSVDVQKCLPQTPATDQGVSSTHVETPLMNNHQETHSNAVDAINGHSTSKDMLLNRKYLQNTAIDMNSLDPAKQFAVASYNILAECHRKRDDYSHAKEEVLEQGYRHRRLMIEVKYLDADVLCMQEVDPDYYTNTLEPALRGMGYESEYKKRVDDYHHEGEATFYRTSRFSLVDSSSFAFKDAVEKDLAVSTLTEEEKLAVKEYTKDPSVVLLTKLKCNKSGLEVTVANIHVTYSRFEHPDLQCVQIAYAVNRLVAMAGGLQNPHIICGDFNTAPTWAPFQLARDGFLSDEMTEKLRAMELIKLPDGKKTSLISLFRKGFEHTSPNLESAYSAVQGEELSITSVTAHTRDCLDYIFCSQGDFHILGVLQTPSEAELTEHTSLPSVVFPSDHVSMKAKLALK